MSYDASLGTFLEDQGWVLSSSGPSTVSVKGGMLNLSTLPFSDGACPDPSEPQSVRWRVDDAGLDFDDNTVLEARVRIHSSQYGSNCCTGYPHPGFLLLATDVDGRSFRVGLGSSRIFLANDGFIRIDEGLEGGNVKRAVGHDRAHNATIARRAAGSSASSRPPGPPPVPDHSVATAESSINADQDRFREHDRARLHPR